MKKINEKKFEPTLDEPTSNRAIEFQDNFDKTMVKNNVQLTEIDELLNEKEQSLKKKIFSLSKMEALVFADPKLSAVYDEMATNGEEKYGYHYNETIMNIIFNDYVLNSSKYLQKYKQAIPKEKKRRDKSGINKIRKDAEEMEKKRAEYRKQKAGKKENIKSLNERMNRLNENSNSTISAASSYETPIGFKDDVKNVSKEIEKPYYDGGKVIKQSLNENMDLNTAKSKAQKISKEEGVVQHVNRISNNKYSVQDFYDDDSTIISYENGKQLNESTVASDSGAFSTKAGDDGKYESNMIDTDKEWKNLNSPETSKIGEEKRMIDKKNNKKSNPVDSDNYVGGSSAKPSWKGGKILKNTNNTIKENHNVMEEKDTKPKKSKEENEDNVEETTSAASAAGGGSSYVGYAGPIAWGKGDLTKGKKTKKDKKSFWKGGEVIKESNYLLESEGFENFIKELNEEINQDMISTKEDLQRFVKQVREKTGKGLTKYHIPMLAGDALYTVAIQLADKMLPLPWNQMSDTNSMWDYIDENGGMKYEEFVEGVKEAVSDRLAGEDMGFENLMEHHADTREEKIEYIIKYLKSEDQYGKYVPPINWLNSLDDNVIDTMYKNAENIQFTNKQLNEKSKSKAQQKFMGMVHAYKKGDLKGSEASDSVKKAAKSMTDKEVEDFASTKHDKLPEKVNEHHLETRDDKLNFILKAGEHYFGPEVFDKNLQYKEWSKLPDDRIHKLYLNMEKILKQNNIDPTTISIDEARRKRNNPNVENAISEIEKYNFHRMFSQPSKNNPEYRKLIDIVLRQGIDELPNLHKIMPKLFDENQRATTAFSGDIRGIIPSNWFFMLDNSKTIVPEKGREYLLNKLNSQNINEANELNNKWEGVDADTEISLFEYGFVASQPDEKDYPDEWFVIYKIGDDKFGTGWIREAELNNIVSGNDWANEEDVQRFLSFVGQDFNSWLNLMFVNKLSDVINYWGVENIMGTEYSPMDKEEALQRINQEIQENNNSDTYFKDLFSDTMKDVDKTMEYEEAIKKELINKYKYEEDDADTLIASNEKKIDEKRRFGHTSPEIMAKILAHKDGKIYSKDRKVYLSDTNQEIQETMIDDNEDSMKMKQPINVQTGDMPVGMQSSGPMNEQDEQPDEEDCYISSNGFKYSVSCGSKFIDNFEEINDAINAIKTWQTENNYYPNTWFVSDHGNIELMNINTNDKINNIMNEEKYLKQVNKDLKRMNKQHNKLKNIVEERKSSSLVNKDRLGKDNEKNFKSDLKHSGTKEIIDTTKELEWEDQQTDVSKDPQKLGRDIEKKSIKNTKGESFKNVGNSANNKGDEIPKRNLTDEETDEVDLYRKGLGDVNFDNKPDERYMERMKRDMGDEEFKKREDRMEFEAEKPMYNKDTQPVEDGIEKDQFDKNKSEWNKRTSVSESTLTGKYVDEIGKTRFFDFSTLNIIDLKNTKNKNKENMSQVFLEGLGNSYDNKVEINENLNKTINEWNFYTDGKNVFADKKNTSKILRENEQKSEKRSVNEQFNKMKHLLGYNPKNFINTKNIKL